MPGRKQTPARKLFIATSSSGGSPGTGSKLKKLQCKFCHWICASNGTRLANHVAQCPKCPKDVKKKYVSNSFPECHRVTNEKSSLQMSRRSYPQTSAASTSAAMSTSSSEPTELCDSGPSTSTVPLYNVNASTRLSHLFYSHSMAPTCSRKATAVELFIDRMEEKEQKEVDVLLARAIYGSGTPLSIVESQLWENVFQKLRPSYRLPGRYMLSTTLLDAEFERVSADIDELLVSAESLALTCDGWSNTRNQSIINFVITTPTPVLYKTIETGAESHTGDYIANQMLKVIDEVGSSKFSGIVTDNASNMKAAWEKIEEKYPHISCYGCVAHSLNLLMVDISKIRPVYDVVSEASSVIKEVKRSQMLSAILTSKAAKISNKNGIGQGKGTMKCCKQSGSDSGVTSLKLPCKTRWGSHVISLQSIVSNKSALQQVAVDEKAQKYISKSTKNHILSDVFWDRISGVLRCIEPILVWITKIEADTPQISVVAKIFCELQRHFDGVLAASPLSKAKEVVNAALASRKDFCLKVVHKAANLLDPQSIGRHISEDDTIDACEMISNLAVLTDDVNEVAVLADLASYRAKTGLWSKPFIWKASLSVSPLTWWNGMCSSRPLAIIAKKILSLPATSAACERSFSTYANIHTAKRNRLTTSRAGKLVYISQNLKLLTRNFKSNTGTSHGHSNLEDVVEPASVISASPSQLLDLPQLPRLISSDAAEAVLSASDLVECSSKVNDTLDYSESQQLELPSLSVSDYDDSTEFIDDDFEGDSDEFEDDDSTIRGNDTDVNTDE